MSRSRIPTPRDLIGAWTIEAWRTVYADGRVSMPLGKKPVGLLLYSADGRMSASIMAKGRKRFTAANPRDARASERAQAFDGYMGYAGRWRLVKSRIEHVVTVALNPSLVGTRQWREATLTGDRLLLFAEERTPAGSRRHEVLWRRARPTRRA